MERYELTLTIGTMVTVLTVVIMIVVLQFLGIWMPLLHIYTKVGIV